MSEKVEVIDKRPWIFVGDRKPAEGQWVDTKIAGHDPDMDWCFIRRRMNGGIWEDLDNKWTDTPPTHWRA